MAQKDQSKLPKDPWQMVLAGHVAGLYMRLVFATSRKIFHTPENIRRFMESGQNVIMAGWHNRVFLTPLAYRAQQAKDRTFTTIASASKDGAIAAHAMTHLGFPVVRGSSSRRGAAALRQMVKAVKSGHDLGFTPDGPRGPKYKVHEGVILCAKMSGAPIVPISYYPARCKRLSSWDALIVPSPFNRLAFVYGEPVFVDRKADSEEVARCAKALEDELMRIGEVAKQQLQRKG